MCNRMRVPAGARLAGLGAFFVLCLATTSPARAQEIESFSPEGYVRQVRQAAARFTAPMVALGDPRLPDPFEVDCPAKGKGRWADDRNWLYDFDEDLPAGVECHFTLKRGAKARNGRRLSGTTRFQFQTGGPAIHASLPYEGNRDIDEQQIFLLKLDAAATPESIRAHAYCVVEGVGERIPVDLLLGPQRDEVLKQRKALGYDYLRLLWKNGEVADVRVRNRAMEQQDALIVALRCNRRLPPATEVRLNWGAGVAAPSGIATQADQQLAYRVRDAFMAEVGCTRQNARSGCIPLLPITVNFSAPVPRALALAVRLKTRNGTAFTPAADGDDRAPTLTSVTFSGPFPESTDLTVTLPNVTDDAGRELVNAARFPLQLRIDADPPLAKFSGNFGILESHEGGVLPVTLRNVEPKLAVRSATISARTLRLDDDPTVIAAWLQRVEKANEPSGAWAQDTGAHSVFNDADHADSVGLPKPASSKAAEVIGIPLKRPGFYVVELKSRVLGASLLGRDVPRFVSTSALVTDLAVHFKWGREASRVWVTQLSDGAPVKNAAVVVVDYCSGKTVWGGRTDGDGIAGIADSLGEPHGNGYCYGRDHDPLLVLAKKGDDFSFTLSAWDQGIAPHQFAVPVGSGYSTAMNHTVLDRSLFKAGETVSMKHFLRRHVLNGIDVPPSAHGTHSIRISHERGNELFELSAEFDAAGVADTQWTIPNDTKLGIYAISIDGGHSGQFRVEQFRLPSMHASILGSAKPLVRPTHAELDAHVVYMSGGGASGLPVKVRMLVEPQAEHYPDYSDYQFGGEPLTEGVTTSGNGPDDYDFDNEKETTATKTRILPATLDGSGAARIVIGDLPVLNVPAVLTAELEYADANGEILTTTGHVKIVPASVTVGIRTDGWVASREKLKFRVVALDLDGRPRPQQRVTVALFQSNAYSYRKRLIGGFYAYESTREVKKLEVACTGITDEKGLLLCELSPQVSGQVLVRAETQDAEGRSAGATASMWVAGKDDWWFGGTAGDRMDVLPERKEYEAGDMARFQVRMPFRAATALVTVEREGVLKSFVTRLKGDSPVIEVPIDGNYSPNVFVSVLAVRGRVAHVESAARKVLPAEEITALVDLNKPAYRLGMAEIKVGWRPHRLDVHVEPSRQAYQVRDRASVRIRVLTADGTPVPMGTEVAIAAVDEALLELAPNKSWNLLDAMMGERGLEVWTSTAQMQVVGKRHYGRKAVPHGGGGGRERDRARELFDSLLYWKARLVVDAKGEARVDIPLNDSLSSFRIAAIAYGGEQLFGTGSATIRTTQDVILVSGLPPVVREGDQYTAVFTVRNTTDHAVTVLVNPKVSPLRQLLAPQQADIAAGQSRDLSWIVAAPFNRDRLVWDVSAADVAGPGRDRLKITESVTAAFPVRTYQATIAQLTAPLAWPAARPAGAIPGRGGLEVTLQGKLAGNLDGVHEYMSRYPYICLEQQTSRAIALRDRVAWDRLMDRLPLYMDRDGLLKYFPTDWLDGDDTLTAYVLTIAQQANWPLTDADRDRLLHALTRFVEGRIVRASALPTADLAIRKLAAIAALSRYQAAQSHMLDSLTIEPNLWPTSAVLDWLDILARVPGIADKDARSQAAYGILRARLNFQGTLMGFSTEQHDALWWLMISTDSNANRMLLAALDQKSWRDDIPRLVRGALSRQLRGHWNTTVANAWGVLAIEKFSAAFESTTVTGTSTVRYGADEHPIIWPLSTASSQVELPWQEGTGTLQVTHAGTGAPWTMVRATAALPVDRPLFTGFKVQRSIKPVEQQVPGSWSRGDVARVHLDLDAQSDMTWVVVDDPIPSGATILGGGLGGQSALLCRDDTRRGWAWLAFDERTFQAYRAYYRFVPKGHWSLEYTVRFNNPGTFVLPATRVEAMYAPEMFGEIPNSKLIVKPSN